MNARPFLLASLVASAACGGCGPNSAGTDAASPDGTPAEGDGSPAPPSAGSPTTPAPGPTTPAPGPTTPAPTEPAFPRGLTCLAKHFVGQSENAAGGGYALKLPDGTRLTWDDGQTKTFEQKLESPDLEDTLSMPYVPGPIVPVNTLNDDPGRIRNDVLFKATFGATSAAVESKLVTVDFVGQNVKFHAKAAPALSAVSTRLKQLIAATSTLSQYVTGPLGGTFEWRPIANTTRMSAHSYGIAIDIVVSKSNYWEWEKQGTSFTWKNKIPQAIVDAFEAEGFAWGGRWYHYDTMHFEYRPELFDATCR